jgi:glutamyl-tRNA synthetase
VAAVEEVERRVRRIALANAVEHGGAPQASAVLGRLLASDPSLRARGKELEATVSRVVSEVARLTPEGRAQALQALGGDDRPEPTPERAPGELPPLPDAVDGRVVLRLAPFPSGALHIGNARMLYVNDAYRRRYHGKLLLVFDDTAGSEEKRVDLELFDVIRGDLDIAGTPPDAVYYKSDRIASFYPWARRVIDRGAAYVCRCAAEVLRENRRAGRPCAHRSEDVARTLEEWERMLSGRYEEGEAVLRLKTDLSDPDPAFRDRVLFRISTRDHPRVGHKFRVWPLLEFSWAVDDLELGITHVLRGKDLVMEDRMEAYLWNLLGLHGPPFVHWGLLRIREAKISKSKSYLEVKSGEYDGWADPRTWSVRSLDRRGILPAALRQFTLSFGLSLADIEVPAETLYAENRQLIDGTTPRRAFASDAIRVEVEGYPSRLHRVSLPNHPDRPEMGKREVAAGPVFWLPRLDLVRNAGREIRLKDLMNIQLPATVPGTGTGPLAAQFTSEPNQKLPRIQWVGAEGALAVDVLTPEGQHVLGIGEASLAEAPAGQRYQFERYGFVRVEADQARGATPVRVAYGHP